MSGPLFCFDFTFNCPDGTADAAQWALDNERELKAFLGEYCDKWVFQLEQVGRLHFQGRMSLKMKKRKLTLVKLMEHRGFEGIHVRPTSNAGAGGLWSYVMKEESRVKGPWVDEKFESRQPKLFQRGGEIPKRLQLVEEKPFHFQEQLTAYCMGPVDDRKVLWLGDPEGCSGKSAWATLMAVKYGAAMLTYGKADDVANAVIKMGRRKVYIFALPRAKPKEAFFGDMANVMEQLKDGVVQSFKYESGFMTMEEPHVIVLANYFPDENERKGMTPDRWDFRAIEPLFKGLVTWHPRAQGN